MTTPEMTLLVVVVMDATFYLQPGLTRKGLRLKTDRRENYETSEANQIWRPFAHIGSKIETVRPATREREALRVTIPSRYLVSRNQWNERRLSVWAEFVCQLRALRVRGRELDSKEDNTNQCKKTRLRMSALVIRDSCSPTDPYIYIKTERPLS